MTGVSISTAFYIVVSIAAFLLESPWPGESLLDAVLSTHYLFYANFSIPVGVVGMLVDWYLFVIAIPAVWGPTHVLHEEVGAAGHFHDWGSVSQLGRISCWVLLTLIVASSAAVASSISLRWRVHLNASLGSDSTWDVGYVLLWA